MAERSDSPVPAELIDDYYGIALLVGEQNSDDFGYPIVKDGEIVLPVTSEKSSPIAQAPDQNGREQALVLYEKARRADLSSSGKDVSERMRLDSAPVMKAFETHIVTVDGTRSFKEVEQLKSDILDFAVQPTFAEAKAAISDIDLNSGHAVLTVENLTPELADGLVQEFGADHIAVDLEPTVESGPGTGNRNQDRNPFYGGARIYAPGGCTPGSTRPAGVHQGSLGPVAEHIR